MTPKLDEDRPVARWPHQQVGRSSFRGSVGVITFFITTVIIYASDLGSFSLSIDEELEAFRHGSGMWISQGRWTAAITRALFVPVTTLPFFPHFLFVIGLVATYLIMLEAHQVENKLNLDSLIVFAVFAAFPTWSFLTEFSLNLPSIAVAMPLSAFAVLIWARVTKKRRFVRYRPSYLWFLGSALSLTIAIGAYQSTLFVFLVGVVGLSIQRSLYEGLSLRILYTDIGKAILISLTALAAYYAIDAIVKVIFSINAAYVGQFVKPARLFYNPVVTLRKAMAELLVVYVGWYKVYMISAPAIGVAVVACICSIAWTMPRQLNKMAVLWLLLIAMLALPFTLNVLSGGYMPYRSLLAVPYVIWLLFVIALTGASRLLRAVLLSAAVMLVLQVMYVNSALRGAAALALKHDEALANRIYARIEAVNDTNDVIPVMIWGGVSYESPFYRPATVTYGSSFFGWDGGRAVRIVSFMKLLGYDRLQQVPDEQRLAYAPIFKAMPNWPRDGSVRRVNGVTLIKLSNRDCNPSPQTDRSGSGFSVSEATGPC